MRRQLIGLGPLLACCLAAFLCQVARADVPGDGARWQTELASHVAQLDSEMVGFRSEFSGEVHTELDVKGASCDCCSPGWFVTSDYLNLRVERNDLAFAIQDPVGAGVPSAGPPIMSLDLGSQNAFRVGGGYRDPSGWQVGVIYTLLRSDTTETFAPGGGQVLAVQSSPSTGLTNADSVTATSDFAYDVFDLEAGHWFQSNDSISLLVLAGLRFASIDHRLRTAYNGGAFVNGLVDVPTNINAFGGRLGGAAHWNVSDRFSLIASSSISILKADIDTSRREVNGGATVINATRATDQLMPGLDLSVGLRYYFERWSIAASYEWANWFNAVSPLEFSDSFNGGTLNPVGRDLGLHGFVLNASFAW
jgi:hypothetical protein